MTFWLFFSKRGLMTSEVTEVTEVNFLEVTKELFIYIVVPENGSFRDLLARSNYSICGLKWPRRSSWKVAEGSYNNNMSSKINADVQKWLTDYFK